MKKIALIVLGLLMIILGMSVLDKFLFLGISLNMLLIYTGILALQTDIKTNYICVFTVACIYDLLISPFFGINIVWTLAATFVARTIMDKLYCQFQRGTLRCSGIDDDRKKLFFAQLSRSF